MQLISYRLVDELVAAFKAARDEVLGIVSKADTIAHCAQTADSRKLNNVADLQDDADLENEIAKWDGSSIDLATPCSSNSKSGASDLVVANDNNQEKPKSTKERAELVEPASLKRKIEYINGKDTS
ncbi:hypothetical protein AYI70_g9414 [Smittium culicis]|uniref:Uncharacterized protein n=1 Tax=Smittium culicis TaxID=133412 RepID=A0A1R1XBC0_9FUNG|nr:hypothetical protein AYI70_g9414 [Smittium culicis]